MANASFERARSADAKQQRERAILESARTVALARGVRAVTLTEIAAGIGMHKSTMLRYFETREEIFLRLTRDAWAEWAADVVLRLGVLPSRRRKDTGPAVARLIAASLVQRPLFCDLLAQAPLNLEHGVSAAVVKEFKLVAIGSAADVAAAIGAATGLPRASTRDVVATATAMAGALWQMAAPGTPLRRLYETDPDLAHAVVDVEPRLSGILTALLAGFERARP